MRIDSISAPRFTVILEVSLTQASLFISFSETCAQFFFLQTLNILMNNELMMKDNTLKLQRLK